jgi:transcriptional regulator with XRE-family HTH domain
MLLPMGQSTELGILLRGLKAQLQQQGRTLGEASQALDRHPAYLSRVLSGHRSLKVDELFALLGWVGLEPADFFAHLFPLGGRPAGATPSRPPRHKPAAAPEAELELPPAPSLLSPNRWADLTAQLLRRHIRTYGRTQREISRALGLSQDALGLALRGGTQLHCGHVFGVLAQLGESAGRFWTELALGEEAIDDTAWAGLLDQWDDLLSRARRVVDGER